MQDFELLNELKILVLTTAPALVLVDKYTLTALKTTKIPDGFIFSSLVLSPQFDQTHALLGLYGGKLAFMTLEGAKTSPIRESPCLAMFRALNHHDDRSLLLVAVSEEKRPLFVKLTQLT